MQNELEQRRKNCTIFTPNDGKWRRVTKRINTKTEEICGNYIIMKANKDSSSTIKILIVCHGNICRSPMAEYVMKDMVKRAGLEERYEIASAATSYEEIGNPVYPPAKRELARHGIGCAGHMARHLERSDYDYYDYLVGMEDVNLRNMRRICSGDPEGKMHLLMAFAGKDQAIDDPWYTGRFGEVYDQIADGCAAMLRQLEG